MERIDFEMSSHLPTPLPGGGNLLDKRWRNDDELTLFLQFPCVLMLPYIFTTLMSDRRFSAQLTWVIRLPKPSACLRSSSGGTCLYGKSRLSLLSWGVLLWPAVTVGWSDRVAGLQHRRSGWCAVATVRAGTGQYRRHTRRAAQTVWAPRRDPGAAHSGAVIHPRFPICAPLGDQVCFPICSPLGDQVCRPISAPLGDQVCHTWSPSGAQIGKHTWSPSGAQSDLCATRWPGMPSDLCTTRWPGMLSDLCTTRWQVMPSDQCVTRWPVMPSDQCATRWPVKASDLCTTRWPGMPSDLCTTRWPGMLSDLCTTRWPGMPSDLCTTRWPEYAVRSVRHSVTRYAVLSRFPSPHLSHLHTPSPSPDSMLPRRVWPGHRSEQEPADATPTTETPDCREGTTWLGELIVHSNCDDVSRFFSLQEPAAFLETFSFLYQFYNSFLLALLSFSANIQSNE